VSRPLGPPRATPPATAGHWGCLGLELLVEPEKLAVAFESWDLASGGRGTASGWPIWSSQVRTSPRHSTPVPPSASRIRTAGRTVGGCRDPATRVRAGSPRADPAPQLPSGVASTARRPAYRVNACGTRGQRHGLSTHGVGSAQASGLGCRLLVEAGSVKRVQPRRALGSGRTRGFGVVARPGRRPRAASVQSPVTG